MITKALSSNQLSVSWINGLAVNAPDFLVTLSERVYRGQIDLTARTIANQKNEISVLLISGPSASTKTTTASKLSASLLTHGIESVVISLDDFFVNRCDIPLEPDGSVDFESIKTLDISKLYHCIEELLCKGESAFPIFDFKSGHRREDTHPVKIGSNTLLIVEGIHALNPAIVVGHDPSGFRRIFICPDSDYYLDDKLVLTARQVRLTRRIVRDYYHRGNTIGRTFDMWSGVVSSELVNIIPFKAEADFIIDSTICYEPNIYSAYLERILDEQPVEERYEEKLYPLRKALAQFIPLNPKHVPFHTVLREFLP